MDRRLLVVPGVLLVLLFAADVSVVHWQATLRAGAGLDGRPPTSDSRLPAACRAAAAALAEGRTVSLEGYRVAPGSVDVVLERTSVSERWTLGDANCAERLASSDNLRVGDRSYRVLGRYSRDRLDRTPLFGLARLGSGVVGVGLLAAGSLATVHRSAR
jgi:hypothetical protein